jgi:hypothetical protein
MANLGEELKEVGKATVTGMVGAISEFDKYVGGAS